MPDSLHQESSIHHGLDRKDLKTITQRFMQVNAARLARTRLALNRQQQTFLDLLPLFFQANHPMLPGFVTRDTPKGVAGYKPSNADVQRAQRIARSFTYHREPDPYCQIDGIYLMGSCGTIAQSGVSDLDIWLCHGSHLAPDAVSELERKCRGLERYAETLSLEVHFFLMDADSFRLGRRASLSTEDCGSTQHYLLLDEFYRTGLIIAGKPPIWWLIPPEEEIHYDFFANTLRQKKYIARDETIDFGGIPQIPAGEFVGAGIWQLYKGISSPYKSVLKLLLVEVYASEYPLVENLSALYKRAIYQDQLDIDELDPYVLIYRKLERYLLARNEHKRLELVRRCFYLKVGKKLSKPPQHHNASWQRLLTQKLVGQWAWDQGKLELLDNHHQWRAPQVMEERKELVRELTSSYRFLLDFARRTQASAHINAQEMAVLGRKLYAAFERRAGKVEQINPGISNDISEEVISFRYHQRDDQWLWSAHPEHLSNRDLPTTAALKRGQTLMELLAWCHINGIIDSATRLEVCPGEHQLDNAELIHTMRALQQHLPLNLLVHQENSQAFTRAANPLRKLVFVNVGIDPLLSIKQRGLQRLSSHTDSLGFSGLRENLVITLDEITLNSWHEVSTSHFEGNDALLDYLRNHLETCAPDNPQAQPQIQVFCFCASRAPAIQQRIEELMQDIGTCFYSSTRPPQSRYVLQIQESLWTIQYLGQKSVRMHRARSEAALLHYLGEPQQSFSPVVLDRYSLRHSLLMVTCPHNHPGTIQVFFSLGKNSSGQGVADVYVFDERGSLHAYQTPYFNDHTLLNPLAQFLQSSQFRQNSENIDNLDNPLLTNAPTVLPVVFYEIKGTGKNALMRQRYLDMHNDAAQYFNVQAIGERDAGDHRVFSIYCDQQEFSAIEYGEEIYHKVAEFILARRRKGERYPCYITDLDLSRTLQHEGRSQNIQTVQYLRYKQLLEKRINDALSHL